MPAGGLFDLQLRAQLVAGRLILPALPVRAALVFAEHLDTIERLFAAARGCVAWPEFEERCTALGARLSGLREVPGVHLHRRSILAGAVTFTVGDVGARRAVGFVAVHGPGDTPLLLQAFTPTRLAPGTTITLDFSERGLVHQETLPPLLPAPCPATPAPQKPSPAPRPEPSS